MRHQQVSKAISSAISASRTFSSPSEEAQAAIALARAQASIVFHLMKTDLGCEALNHSIACRDELGASRVIIVHSSAERHAGGCTVDDLPDLLNAGAKLHPQLLHAAVNRVLSSFEDIELWSGDLLAAARGPSRGRIRAQISGSLTGDILPSERLAIPSDVQANYKALQNSSTDIEALLTWYWEMSQLRSALRYRTEFFVGHHLRLVAKFLSGYQTHPVDIDELFQEGMVGLVHAAEMFIPDCGNAFGTYAGPWIRQAISRYAFANARSIKLPTTMRSLYSRYIQLNEDLRADIPKAAMELGVSESRLQEMLGFGSAQSISLDEPRDQTRSDGRALSEELIQTQETSDWGDPMANLSSELEIRTARALLNRLKPEERTAVLAVAESPETATREIAKRLGTSSYLLKKHFQSGMAKLKEAAGAMGLRAA